MLIEEMLHQNFNPRSREGSDNLTMKSRRAIMIFQSTLPRRERLRCFRVLFGIIKFQSTLPRRERLLQAAWYLNSNDFNPRSREGSDGVGACISLPAPGFQSTLPRRERLWWLWTACGATNFNPRSREGSDKEQGKDLPSNSISIHAPAKGATFLLLSPCARHTRFQSTLPRRERPAVTG